MYQIHNGGIKNIKNIYKYMTSVSQNVFIEKLNDIVGEYNNTYHRTIQIRSIDIKDNTYIDFKRKKLMIKTLNLKLTIM